MLALPTWTSFRQARQSNLMHNRWKRVSCLRAATSAVALLPIMADPASATNSRSKHEPFRTHPARSIRGARSGWLQLERGDVEGCFRANRSRPIGLLIGIRRRPARRDLSYDGCPGWTRCSVGVLRIRDATASCGFLVPGHRQFPSQRWSWCTSAVAARSRPLPRSVVTSRSIRLPRTRRNGTTAVISMGRSALRSRANPGVSICARAAKGLGNPRPS
jgi:hypothetical protein